MDSLVDETPATPPTPASETPAATPPTTEAPKTETPSVFDAAKYTAPEGISIDAEAMGKFSEVAKAQGLTQAQGDALIGMWNEMQAKAAEQQSSAWNALQDKWRNEITADKEFGGQKLTSEVLPTISRAISQFGSPELKDALNITGAGNNPAVIKFVYQMAKAVTEGGPVQGKAVAQGEPPRTAADIMYRKE